jgi:hypothetical protein
MAGLIAALFGGKSRPPDPDPLPGLGGVSAPPGPAGQTGFPGSTAQTRTFPGRNPSALAPRSGDWTTIKATTNYGFDQGLSGTPQVRQASFRGDIPGAATRSPRSTSLVATPQPDMTVGMQETPGTFYGGPTINTAPGNATAGGELQRKDAHDPRDTTTLWKDAQPLIGPPAPGAENVRNTIAERYKNAPGQLHTYRSRPRPDQAPVNPGGQATDGNVHPDAVTSMVTVPNRFVFDGGASQSWSVLRQMPYTGRGDGARGADLNGQRYYAQNTQENQFWNAGQGGYGIGRLQGSGVKLPVGFTEPAPWTSQLYLTTDSVGSSGSPNPAPQQVAQGPVYSPGSGRASNSTGRTS